MHVNERDVRYRDGPLMADSGWRYLSTDLWTRQLDELSDELEGSLSW